MQILRVPNTFFKCHFGSRLSCLILERARSDSKFFRLKSFLKSKTLNPL